MAKIKKNENYSELEEKAKKLEGLLNLTSNIIENERRKPITFNDFLFNTSNSPDKTLRNIFQLFNDMMSFYVGDGVDEYSSDKFTIGFKNYNFDKLFIENSENPFFADRLFANRLMNLTETISLGVQTNRFYLFEGPPGSGKSTFLNNFLKKLEDYTKTKEGTLYTTLWRIDKNKINDKDLKIANSLKDNKNDFLEISCPSNDHPILQIPKYYRRQFLETLISDEALKKEIFESKKYEWIFKDDPCSICSSIFNSLIDKVDQPLEVFDMIYAKALDFSRQFGRGISVYNPGDIIYKNPIENNELQNKISSLFNTDEIKYVYSPLSSTNNGVYSLMDIKEYNIDRLLSLHGIISDGVHKVKHLEEHIRTMFIGVINPEDKRHYENIKSFQDRITTINVPYILDYNTEVNIYKNKFGENIEALFLPRVLKNFAKIIISTRLERNSPAIRKWINPDNYSKHIDKNMLLLKMDIYTGKIPTWIKENDLDTFTPEIRRNVIGEAEKEGVAGFSGRQSLVIFNNLIKKHSCKKKLITMENIKSFFIEYDNLEANVPEGFIDSLNQLYEFNILEEVKESIYYYNKNQIAKDIQNYIESVNYEIGEQFVSKYTNDNIEVTEDFYKNFEFIVLGSTVSNNERRQFRNNVLNEYIKKTLSQEINVERLKITETELFNALMDRYIRNLKDNALAPYSNNDNFRRAILDYNNNEFKNYDNKIKKSIEFLVNNMINKFNYTKEGALQTIIYVIDKKLDSQF